MKDTSLTVLLSLLCATATSVSGCNSSSPALTEKVADGIYRIRASRSNVYLLAGDSLVLIDTGMKGDGKAILQAIESIGRKPREVSYILITHAHIDHTGSLAFLKQATGAKVVASAQETEYVAGRKKTWTMEREGFGGKIFKLMLYFMETFFFKYEPATVDLPCKDGDVLECFGTIYILDTPGHSPGSVSYYLPEKEIIFVGDALSGVPEPKLPPRAGCADYQQALQSVKKIAGLIFEKCCFGHGNPLKTRADVSIRQLI
jgi:glyoxylase-like metal-dependent hydrolase (beta-lactamase superfamily II)